MRWAAERTYTCPPPEPEAAIHGMDQTAAALRPLLHKLDRVREIDNLLRKIGSIFDEDGAAECREPLPSRIVSVSIAVCVRNFRAPQCVCRPATQARTQPRQFRLRCFRARMVVIQTINFANPADPIRRVTEIKCLGPQYARRKSLSTNHLGPKEQQNATTRMQWKLLPGRSSSSVSMSRVKRTRVLTSGLTNAPASQN